VLQIVAVCCIAMYVSGLQHSRYVVRVCVAVFRSMWHCGAGCCSALQGVAVPCICMASEILSTLCVGVCWRVLQCVAVCCSAAYACGIQTSK